MTAPDGSLHPVIDERLRDLAAKAEAIVSAQINGLKRQLDEAHVPADMQASILLAAARKAQELAMAQSAECRRARREGR
ncbi:hypothetical protein HN018_06705 [Lichenicola cladoniae]|uniref:Uncharacterized protein n=1 Tax=Lichenicola cladoniae TaxID=1484109 RepID=A0A6M8HNA9_9PROT|nr:hypothetical protein [Lichenicola cladoniae]NPD67262.1 hypothetical protein [Acetobacteraceae bacterium]QKE89767.1 hypothetical protein HN018_06705 [Lichenicola cladoniae]